VRQLVKFIRHTVSNGVEFVCSHHMCTQNFVLADAARHRERVIGCLLIKSLRTPLDRPRRYVIWWSANVTAGVEITTRQLAKCEWNLELASNFLNVLASLASVFFLLSVSLFPPLIESYSSPIPKYKHTPDTVIYLLLWHTHTVIMVYFSSRTSTKCTLYKCSAKTWFWRVFLWFGE
jgi:hypothetical protein